MVNLQQIAKAVGVSRMTVSRALRNDPSVSEETRIKVIEVAQSMGYAPNPLLSAWMARVAGARKSRFEPILYYLVRSKDSAASFRVVWYQRYFAFAKARAAELGFRLEVMLIPEGMSGKRLSEILHTRNCPGVIVSPFYDTATDSLDLDWNKFSSITMGYSLTSPDLHRVCLNHSQGMTHVLTSLLERKMGRIGYVLRRYSDERVRHLMLSSYLGFRFHHRNDHILEPLFLEELDEKVFNRWFQRNQPDVLILSDRVIIGWIEAIDKRPPESRCKVVHLDENYANDPRIFGVLRSQSENIGRAAAELLISLIRNNSRGIPAGSQSILIPTEFELMKNLPAKQYSPTLDPMTSNFPLAAGGTP